VEQLRGVHAADGSVADGYHRYLGLGLDL